MPAAFLLGAISHLMPIAELDQQPSELLDHTQYLIETSPGNYQAGYILANPLTDQNEATRLINAIIAKGLSDPGATGVARWARLPNGINGKEKYKSESGDASQCRLVRWNPERSYTLKKMAVGLKLDLNEVKAPSHRETGKSIESASREVNAANVAKLPALLAAIDPDCSRPAWMNAMMATHHTTGGDTDGLRVFDAWSSNGSKYKGFKDVEKQWKSLDGHEGSFIKIGTLISMARAAGGDVDAYTSHETFEPVVGNPNLIPVLKVSKPLTVTAPAMVTSSGSDIGNPPVGEPANSLVQYSLRDGVEELERNLVAQLFILGNLALMGQAAVYYALANTGKTLIVLYLLIQAIKAKLIDPANLIYINMDDNSHGLLSKAKLAEEYGFHMIADGHKGFEAKLFRESMLEMIENDTARGVVIVIDTLKKFVDTMSKTKSSNFSRVVRQFVMKGGTVIALAHANKNPSDDGRIVYSGTTDIVDDFDCAYTLKTIGTDHAANLRVVEFTNIKRRGSVALNAAYSFSTESALSYNELLLSVQEVDPSQLQPMKQAVELESDTGVIAAITASIGEGINTKMKLADAASKRAEVSNRAALKAIEKYTGTDPSVHLWTFGVRERGAKVFQLLDSTPATPSELPPAAA